MYKRKCFSFTSQKIKFFLFLMNHFVFGIHIKGTWNTAINILSPHTI